MIQTTTLPNGLRVATDRMEGVESVSLGLWVGVGTRHEEAQDNGIAHLVEHMLFKGTKRRSAFDISAEMENVGGHLNAYTTRESTAYYVKVLKEDVALGADVLCDMMQNAVLDEVELDRERGVIVQEIGQSIDQPDDIIFDLLQKQAYPNSGIGRPVLGEAEIIRTIARSRLEHYITSHYAASQIIFSAAGAVEHDKIVALAAQYLDKIPAKATTQEEKAVYAGGDAREERDIEQLHVALSFDGVAYYDPDYYAYSVLSTLLGGGMSSRLFQEIREKRGLVYSIYTYSSSYRDTGQFGLYAGTDPERINELMPVVADEMRKVTQGVTMEEVLRAKAQLRSSLFMAQESTMNRAERLAYNLMLHDRIIPASEIMERIEKVTPEDITRVMEKVLRTPLTSAFVGPLAQVPDGKAIQALFA
jgi:predicted Zn-dependent peptidase